jgi:LysR family transcriptional regulator, transcriptional activator for dmlA
MAVHESELRFFTTLAKAGSLTAAARELDLTPPAVSKRLAQLEARLGVRLLNRTTRRMGLTNEGLIYLESARRILEEIAELERVVASSRSVATGLLRVNAPLGFGRSYIGPATSEFAKAFPEVDVQLQLSDHSLILVDESIDVCIRFGKIPDTHLVARRIAPNRRLICASPQYFKKNGRPKTPSDLAKHNCLVLRQNEDAYGIWRLTRGQKTHTVKVHGSLSSNDGEILTNWALDAHGVVLRAEWDIAKYLRTGRLERALEDYAAPLADIYAVYHERHHLSAKVKEFIDFLITWFRPGQVGNGAGRAW